MGAHQITIEEITKESYIIEETICAQYCEDMHKQLIAKIDILDKVIMYVVKIKRAEQEIYENLKDAIEHYNKI